MIIIQCRTMLQTVFCKIIYFGVLLHSIPVRSLFRARSGCSIPSQTASSLSKNIMKIPCIKMHVNCNMKIAQYRQCMYINKYSHSYALHCLLLLHKTRMDAGRQSAIVIALLIMHSTMNREIGFCSIPKYLEHSTQKDKGTPVF